MAEAHRALELGEVAVLPGHVAHRTPDDVQGVLAIPVGVLPGPAVVGQGGHVGDLGEGTVGLHPHPDAVGGVLVGRQQLQALLLPHRLAQLHRDVLRAGTTVHIKDEFLGVQEKHVKDKPYRMLIETGRRHFLDQNDREIVVVTANTVITCAYPEPREEGDSAVFGKKCKPFYSDEQLDMLHRHYEDCLAGRFRRGAEIRYWEDVQEGEELPFLMKGPLDIVDQASFMCAAGYRFGCGATKWEMVSPRRNVRDPETNEWTYPVVFHISERMSHVMGYPLATIFGGFGEAWTSQLVTDWAGDHAFVKRLSHQMRRPSFEGDLITVKGHVVRKYIENGEHLVDIEMWTENQDGVILVPSKATVRLLCRQEA